MVPFPVIFLKLKKKITADAAKYVLRTINTYPSPEVFLRSMRELGGLLSSFFFSNVLIIGDPVAKKILAQVVYYESRKRELKTRLMNEGRCDERLKGRVKESTCLTYTGLNDKTN
jgi:hypothetical protein